MEKYLKGYIPESGFPGFEGSLEVFMLLLFLFGFW
jgi:hypothetical protein